MLANALNPGQRLIDYCRAKGITEITDSVFKEWWNQDYVNKFLWLIDADVEFQQGFERAIKQALTEA